MEKESKSLPESKENQELSLKKATAVDVEDYLRLERAVATSKTYSGVLTETEALQEFKENEVYLIYADGKLVGSVGFQRKAPNRVYISGLVVHPDFQGRGIGREVIGVVLEKLKDTKRMEIVVHPENERALNMYKSFGFKVEERREDYYGDGEPRLVLVREN